MFFPPSVTFLEWIVYIHCLQPIASYFLQHNADIPRPQHPIFPSPSLPPHLSHSCQVTNVFMQNLHHIFSVLFFSVLDYSAASDGIFHSSVLNDFSIHETTFPCFTSYHLQLLSSSFSSSVHGILQARILAWVAILFSRGCSGPRGWTRVYLHYRQIPYLLRQMSHQESSPPPFFSLFTSFPDLTAQ